MEVPGLGDHVWLVPCLSLLSQHVPGSMLPSKLLEWTEPDEERCLCNAVRARSCTLFLQTFLLLVDSDSLLFLLRLLSHMPVCLSSPVGGPPSRLPCLPSPCSALKPLLLSPPFHSYELLADLLGLSHYKWNIWGSLDVHPILDHQGRQRRGVIKPQVVDRAGRMLVGQLKKGRVSHICPEKRTRLSVCVCHPCPWMASHIAVLCSLPVPRGPPSTTILASSNKVKGGDDVSVLCTVLGEPDVEVEFRWTYPGQKVSVARPRPAALVSSSLFTPSQ